MSESVVLTEVPSESEAAIVCGFLESAGIDAIYRPSMGALTTGLFGTAGTRHEIVVSADDVDAAQAALAERSTE